MPPLEVQYLPVAGVLVHALHTEVLAYVPIAQAVQLAAPAEEMDPEAQASHFVLDAVPHAVEIYCPAVQPEQSEHDGCLAPLHVCDMYCPPEHELHGRVSHHILTPVSAVSEF